MRKECESRGAAAWVYASIIHPGQVSRVLADTVRFRLVIDNLREHVGLLLLAAVTNLGLHQTSQHPPRSAPQHRVKTLKKKKKKKK